MKSRTAGHTALQTPWPEPLAGSGLWNIGTMALPAPMLSICSAVVFATVVVYLQSGGARQELFVLPWHTAFGIAAAAAGLAWLIVFRCRRRPGRLGPRLWALALAAANSAIAVLTLVVREESWSLTLAVAGLSAAIALSPRLLKVRPDSPMVQRIAPLSLLILLVTVPSSCAVRQGIAGKTADRVDRRIQQLRLWTMNVNEVAAFDWSRMEDAPETAAKEVAKLRTLHFRNEENEVELWRSAAILGKDGELGAAQQELTAAVVAALAPDRAPKVSSLREPAVHWDTEAGKWREYTRFAALSDITGTYHQEMGRLFAELESTDATAMQPGLLAYREHYAGQRKVLQAHLGQLASSWTDHWAAYRVANHGALIGREKAPLDDVLRAPFAVTEGGALAPGQLGQLMSLRIEQVKELACGKAAPAAAPGCLCQDYDHEGREWFRLDCYSYRPRAAGAGATLRIEMRLVYEAKAYARPSEIYFHFVIPPGEGLDNFRDEVMTALATVVRASGGKVRSSDLGGSVAGGFKVEQNGLVSMVRRPTVVALNGLSPEPQALMVRVVPRATAGG